MGEVTLEQGLELRGRVWTDRTWREQDIEWGHSARRGKAYGEQYIHTCKYTVRGRREWGDGW